MADKENPPTYLCFFKAGRPSVKKLWRGIWQIMKTETKEGYMDCKLTENGAGAYLANKEKQELRKGIYMDCK